MEKEFSRLLPPVSGQTAATCALLLALAEVSIDWITHIDVNVAIVYGLPLVVVAAARSRPLLWGMTLVLVSVTFAVYYVQIPSGSFSLGEPRFVDRVLCGLTLVLTASLLHIGLIAADILVAQRQSLKEQNTELDRRRRDAEDASDRKTRIMASVSHDIRTPVHTINLMAELLRHATDDPDLIAQIPDMADRLQSNALALAELVGDVLDMARLDAIKVELQMSEFSLNALLAEECTSIFPLAQTKDLRLHCEAPEKTVWLRNDRVKLVRVVRNLVGNAIKYTETGNVTVSMSLAADRGALIAVRDTGIGIAYEQLPHIFDEFFQLNNPERDRSKGCGLGLAICGRLVAALGGSITVESKPCRGSLFTVRLPPSCVVSPTASDVAAALVTTGDAFAETRAEV